MTPIEEFAEKITAAEKNLKELKAQFEKLCEKKVGQFDPDSCKWVDLGLPSGRQWAEANASGHYDWETALKTFGEYLPSGTAMAELCECCKWTWDDKNKGYDIEGPNGNHIFLWAAGYKPSNKGEAKYVGSEGAYWTSMPVYNSQARARYLGFSSGGVNPLNDTERSFGFAVRPCRELV